MQNRNNLKSIAIFGHYPQRIFILKMSKLLKESDGSDIHIYCRTKESVSFYKENGGEVFCSVNFIDDNPVVFKDKLDAETVVSKSRDYEKKYGEFINWYSLVNRHLGRGYSPGAPYFPRSKTSELIDYIQYLNIYNNNLAYWENEFLSKKFSLFMYPDFLEATIAKYYNCEVRTPTSSRYKNYHYWATDEFWNTNLVERFYKEFDVNLKEEDFPVLEVGPYGQGLLNKKAASQVKLMSLIKRILKKTYSYLYWRYKRAVQRYYYWSEIKYIVRQWNVMKFITGSKTRKLSDISNLEYVFYPLQVEPERNFQGGSPEFFFQHTAILLLSRELPAGCYLLIKEHYPAAGTRHKEFYTQLSDLHNVKLVDSRIPGVELVKKAKAVATINSTAGLEAAIIGKPVITFGAHNIYNFLPHVYCVTELFNIKNTIKVIFNGDYNYEEARVNGAKFIKALKHISYDMKSFSYFDMDGFDDAALKDCVSKLKSSFDINDDL